MSKNAGCEQCVFYSFKWPRLLRPEGGYFPAPPGFIHHRCGAFIMSTTEFDAISGEWQRTTCKDCENINAKGDCPLFEQKVSWWRRLFGGKRSIFGAVCAFIIGSVYAISVHPSHPLTWCLGALIVTGLAWVVGIASVSK